MRTHTSAQRDARTRNARTATHNAMRYARCAWSKRSMVQRFAWLDAWCGRCAQL